VHTPDATDEEDGYADADEATTLLDYRRGDSRTIASSGISVSVPAILSLGFNCRSKSLKAINVGGSVIIDGQAVSPYNGYDDEYDVSDVEENDLMQQLSWKKKWPSWRKMQLILWTSTQQ
jgi:hypothetical protein